MRISRAEIEQQWEQATSWRSPTEGGIAGPLGVYATHEYSALIEEWAPEYEVAHSAEEFAMLELRDEMAEPWFCSACGHGHYGACPMVMP